MLSEKKKSQPPKATYRVIHLWSIFKMKNILNEIIVVAGGCDQSQVLDW